jgi:hypothetical protein
VVENREMANSLIGHDRHTLINVSIRRHAQDPRRHEVPNLQRLRGLALEDDFAGVVPLGHDTDQLLALHHQQCADALVRHQPQRIEYGVVRPDPPDFVPFALKDMPDCLHFNSLRFFFRIVDTRGSFLSCGGVDPIVVVTVR